MKQLINETIEDCKDLDKDELLAGLFILSKDYHEHLSENPRDDAKLFAEVYSEYLFEDSYKYHDSPSARILEKEGLPRGIAMNALNNEINLNELKDRRIIHEWTIGPGKKLFEKFKRKFKDTICGPGGPYKQFEKGLIDQEDLPASIVKSIILTGGFAVIGFWIPLLVYCALLLIKTTLKVYCEE